MKKARMFVLLALLAIGAILAGYLLYPVLSADETGSTEAASETVESRKPVLTVMAGGESVQLYACWSYGMDWTEDGFLCVDAPPLETMLPQLVEDGLIPELVYAEDIAVISETGDEIAMTNGWLYDENYRPQDGDMANLNAGKYYVAIPMCVEGDYIVQAEEHEYAGYNYVFCLIVE